MGVGPGRCRSCKQRIWWVRTEAGNSMPVNPLPDNMGNVAVRHDPESGIDFGYVITEARPIRAGEKQMMPHWATCPEAAKHRKRKPKATTAEVEPPAPAEQLGLGFDVTPVPHPNRRVRNPRRVQS
jgi:hypothetical protein